MNKFLYPLVLLFILAVQPITAAHLSSSLAFTARMSGDQESPAVTTNGQGVAVVSLDQSQSNLYINVNLSSLSSAITGAHIHEGAFGSNGPVVYDLTSMLSGNRIKGTVRNIPVSVLSKLINGSYYINVHTENNPGGEIRGQLGVETDYRYTAVLNGSNENPQVTSDGKGLGIFELTQRQDDVYFKVLFTNLSSALTGAHIHNAAAGSNGPVVFDLSSFIHGNTIEGNWQPGALLSALLAGELYINIHTVDNPGGEIRGQILLSPGLTFDLDLNGDQENPNVVTPASGLGIVTISPDLSEAQYMVVFDSLSTPATGAHFHLADAGVNGGVVIDVTDKIDQNTISGSTPMSLELFNALLGANLYINIHSTTNPDGEIRGQIQKYAREVYTFEMNGGQENPAVSTQATGGGVVTIDRDQVSAHYMVVYSGLEGTFSAAHFHNARPGVNGGVIFPLTSEFNSFGGAYGYWDGTSTPVFTASPLFRNNEVYINVHSSTHSGGEIRGNIVRSSTLFTDLPFDPGFGDDFILSATLTGEDEVPAVSTDAVALATVYFNEDRTKAKVNITATGLSGPITGVHIHEGDPGTNGPVLIPLANQGNRVQMEITDLTDLDLTSIINGATYINIHTAANPNGEIRGQLNLEQDYTFGATLDGEQEVPVVTTGAQGLTSVHYTIGTLSLEINAQFTGLSSAITGAHLHNAALGDNGPVIIDLTDLIDGNTIRGTVEATIPDLINLFTGNVYMNVHTVDNPSGEIRGQMNYLPGITFDGWMSPLQENPFTTSEATGLAMATVYPSTNDIAVWMLVDNTTGPIGAAHLHNAPLLSNGGVVHDLTSNIVGNGLINLGVINDAFLGKMLKGEIYINAHTAAFPAGELRGQLFRLARDGYGFDLCPGQETGNVDAPSAQGSGLVSVDRLHTNINISVVADQLTGPITQSHIHQAAIGVNGGVIADLSPFYQGTSMFLSGATIDTSILNPILAGDTYINIHTAIHPAGEVRGQIVKDFLCTLAVGIDPLASLVEDVQLSPVPVIDQLQVEVDMIESSTLHMSIIDLTGRQLSTNTYTLYAGENHVVLPTDQLLPGFYALLLSDGKRAQAFKFVK